MSDAIPVNRIKGVGEKTAALFGKINVFTVEDLIGHYPRDYETYDAPVSIREASPGSVQAIYGQITAIPSATDFCTAMIPSSSPSSICPF